MLIVNHLAQRKAYEPALREILNVETTGEARRCLSLWPALNPGPTPLWSFSNLAKRWSVEQILVKDESLRASLGSFKALGAPFALLRLIQKRWPEKVFHPEDLFGGKHRHELASFVVTCATDGNHGRALAAAAQSMGCRCVIILHAQVSSEREDSILALGAQTMRIRGDYDDSVREAARLAEANGWEVVSDTSYEGYEEVPRDVMQGYAVMADELPFAIDATNPCPFTHVILQGGVGGFAAGLISHFWERCGNVRPIFVMVEPEQANCLFESARLGYPAAASGSINSVMAGLACGRVSPLAWGFLERTVDFFMTVTDAEAIKAMRLFACGTFGDIPVISGESGAAGLAALNLLAHSSTLRDQIDLNASSRVLIVNTEGATAPELYERLVGQNPQVIAQAQAKWLRQQPREINSTVLSTPRVFL
jgi:diaminopropionate ammonia-lyase family